MEISKFISDFSDHFYLKICETEFNFFLRKYGYNIGSVSISNDHPLLLNNSTDVKSVNYSNLDEFAETELSPGTTEFTLTSDGGGSSFSNPGYGSFFISPSPKFSLSNSDISHAEGCTEKDYIERLTFKDNTTSNEAEYLSLIAGLKYLVLRTKPDQCSCTIHTDSQLLVGQLSKGWAVKAHNLRPLVDEAKQLMKKFKKCLIFKVPRQEIVAILGH